MATPKRFPESNATLGGGPARQYGTKEDVADLPVWRNGTFIVSCWRLSWRERLSALFRGHVWASVVAERTHPPISIQAAKTVFTWSKR